MQQQRVGRFLPPGSDFTRDRGGHAAADAAVGHHRHQHDDREDERDARNRGRSEEADVEGFGDGDEGLHDENGHRRQRQPEHGRHDRPVFHRMPHASLGIVCMGGFLGRRHLGLGSWSSGLHRMSFGLI